MAWENYNNENTTSLAQLGVTATHVRKIKSGAEFEQYFPKSTGLDDVINDEVTVDETLEFMPVIVTKTINDTKKIAQVLKRATLDSTCKSIFDFFYQHYQYKLDDMGVEQVRRPSRAWADRKTGIDCDCFSASVSSVLTNLGIEHYFKIIAINGRENFQHIYVVVPKRQGLDINSRANYWVIDPVLNNYDEEAPKITKTKHLKMNGIPLHQLNGLDTVAGLGNEFEGIDEELNGLDDDSIGRVFHARLKQHITNTRRKIERDPGSVSRIYKPEVLASQYRELESAMDGTEEHLDGVLERLSNREHLAVCEKLRPVYDELHGHDDELYGALYGVIDEKMLDAVAGLGKKSTARSEKKAAKQSKKAANPRGKSGTFTKIKNARKAVKSATTGGKLKGKAKAVVKKVGKAIKKGNPISLAARAGFIMAMRINFAKLAERAYWGYQSESFAISKGIPKDYYQSCVVLLAKIEKVFVQTLAGNQSAIKKAIINGRAAKKIAKLLKAKGMSGTTEALFGLGGLGAEPVSDTAIVTSALAFLTPLVVLMSKLFKGKKSGLEASKGKSKKRKNGSDVNETVTNENGTEELAPSDDANEEMDATNKEASNPSDTTVNDDGSVEAADSANDEDPSDNDGTVNVSKKKVETNVIPKVMKPENTSTPEVDENGNPIKKSNTVLIVGSVVGLSAIALLIAKLKPKKTGVDGLGNFSAKRESKNLQTKLKRAGVKMPHGYQVQKLKLKKVKTIKI